MSGAEAGDENETVGDTGPVYPCGCDNRAKWCREHWREFVKHAERREMVQRERDEERHSA